MKQVNDIQKLIEQKATAKLDKDLSGLRQFFHSGFGVNLLELGDEVELTVGDKKQTLRDALWSTAGPLFVFMKGKLLSKYIEQESSEFLNKVESLSNQVDELMNHLDS